MIQPLLKDDAFLAALEKPPGAADELRLWWLGQSGFLLRYADQRLLLDPYLSDSLTAKYAETDKPHVRMTERVIAPERLRGRVHVVTSSHNHTDHLDPDTLLPLLQADPPPRLIIPEANRAWVAERLKFPEALMIGLDDGTSATVDGFEIHGVAAAHNEVTRDAHGHCHYLGYVVRGGKWTVYHSGDTLRYPMLVEKLRGFAIDLALLPINGDQPERRVAGNLNGSEAAALARDIGARWVIPCHYDMFEFNTASPDDFIAHCDRLGQPYRVLRAGEGWSVPGRSP